VGGHEFYTPDSAFPLREVLENFEGGRVIIGVTSLPYKCPPAPSETALLLHDFLTERGRRDRSGITLVTPQPAERIAAILRFAPQPNVGIFDEPTMQLAADKAEFGRSRARRWFGKEWAV